ncbi:upstream activation factor subunit UAF30 [Trifolium pratense]|uniref:Upstream activation factor subunit UAF30 n=1 Tax=Trifolium pratense TaxID=57577 RepID=A0A2K3P8L5_TRIPR|nr:upstream activation factor subunit UAF30 [Trifolium pratense]
MAPARVFGAFAGRALMAAAAKSATKKAAAASAEASTKTAVKKTVKRTVSVKSTGGIQKVVPVTSELGSFIGSPEVSRTEAVKKVWEYIKLQNLQYFVLDAEQVDTFETLARMMNRFDPFETLAMNPNNKKEIFCDDKLKTIFDGKEKVVFTEIARLLANHFVKTT